VPGVPGDSRRNGAPLHVARHAPQAYRDEPR
jgi:hypothetical protein